MKILITGAASGIGYSLAKELSIKKHKVYLTTHTKEQLETVQKKIKEEHLPILCFKLDITKDADRRIIETLSVDVLICNAAIGNGGSVVEMSTDILRKTYETNIFSNIELIKQFYSSRKHTNNNYKIFVISSIISNIPIPYIGCYSSSKAALSLLIRTLNIEMQYLSKNISISLVEPAAYKTGFNQVMIDNKIINTYKNNKLYDNIASVNRLQRNLFTLVESKNYNRLINKIIKELEKKNPKFLIRDSILQNILVKLYLFISR